MRTTALALLVTAACFTAGCPKKTAETPVTPTDTAENSQAMKPGPPEDSGTPGDSGTPPAPGGGGSAAREACVDRWLQEHHFDNYGSPEGTMYAGGSPLFNEATGETKERLPYVFARQPDAAKACP